MRSPLLLSSLFLGLLACGGAPPSDDAETGETGYTVKPTGGSAEIEVSVPTGTISAKIFARRKDGAGTAVELTAGAAKAVSPGAYCVWTRVTGGNPYDFLFETQSDCNVTVTAGAKLVYALGAVSFTRARDELVFGLDVAHDQYVSDAARRMLATKGAIPHVPGAFEYTYVSTPDGYGSSRTVPLDAYAFTVAASATASVDLLDTTGRFGARVLPATGRALPNAETGIDARVGTGPYTMTKGWADIARLGKPLLIRAKASAQVFVSLPTAQSFALTQPVTDRPLGRLEIEDVQIAMPGGAAKTARGTAKIGSLTLPTGTGVDLLPGKYDLTVSYVHPADGATIVDTYAADVQP